MKEEVEKLIAKIGDGKNVNSKQYIELYKLIQRWNAVILKEQLLFVELQRALYLKAKQNGYSIPEKYRPTMV